MTSPFVDYGASAPAYAKRRAPTSPSLDAWAGAVRTYIRCAGIAVDLGAGTGGYSQALRTWGANLVIAVEPSTAMQAEATPANSVHQATGRAEALPLRAKTVGLVWISTAFHHFENPSEAVRECRRILRDDGYVILRGFVPGHSQLKWLELFPGSEKAISRFPNVEELNRLFQQAGFHLVRESVVEEATQSYGARAEFSTRMRRSDSILTAMSDAEVDAGIAALQQRRDRIEHLSLSCLVYGPPPLAPNSS